MIDIMAGVTGAGGADEKGLQKKFIDNGRITIPAHFWKIVVDLPQSTSSAGQIDSTARLIVVDIPNRNYPQQTSWTNFTIGLDSLERLTGYHFLSNIPPQKKAILMSRTVTIMNVP